jgi:ribosomal protein S18 acetylase RimI-like enzyme
MVSLRAATIADASKLSIFAERVFVETFGKDNTPENMDAYRRATFSPSLQADEITDPEAHVLLAIVETGEFAAYAHLLRADVPPEVGDATSLELRRFYVAQEWHGRGIASLLMDAIKQHAAARDVRTLWLGVWEHNPRAIAFYRKQGYRIVGRHDFMLGDDRQTDLLMAVTL